VGNAPSEGLRRGAVVDLEKTVASITRAVEEAERMAGLEAKGVHAGIAGDHIRSLNSRGVVAVSRKDNEIAGRRRRARDRGGEGDRHPAGPRDHPRHPQEFIVDDQDGIKDPVGHERCAARGRGAHHHRVR
jgi:cell division protein FtsA